MTRSTRLGVLLALSLLFVPLSAQAPKPGLPGVPPAVREALLAGDTSAALAALDQAARELPQLADTLQYLRAAALDHADRRAEVLAALDALERATPQTAWRHKARFLRAEILRRERRFEEAAAIYAEEAGRLSGPARQAELAEVYLRFAEELAALPAPTGAPAAKPDFVRAADLFGRALELGAPDAVRERAAYRRAQCLEASGNWRAAVEAYGAYLRDFDPSWATGAAVRNEAVVGSPAWIFAARLARAGAESRLGDGPGARRTLEDLSAELRRAAAGEGALGTALRRLSGDALRAVLLQDGEAQYALAGTWFQQGDGARSDTGRQGLSLLRRFVERFPDHPRAPRARLELGERLSAAGESEAALAAYDAILALKRPADAAAAKEAAAIAARALYAKGLALSNVDRHAEARDAFVAYTREHPAGADWTEAQQRMQESEYAIGATHREREEFDLAKQSWTEYLARHPLDPRAAAILFDIGELDVAVAQAESTQPEERARRWRAALATWRELESKYAEKDPETTGRARLRIGTVLATELGDFEGAIAVWRACLNTPAEDEARLALQELTEPKLLVSVERAALSGEPLRVKLALRNVEKVTVELWRLDLEAYFRKNLTHADVESLDLDLIDAQQEFEVATTDYARFQSFEQVLDLDLHGVRGPGAWVIAVSAGKLRSSALCLRTDLDLIVKSTPDEALVFAQDMARGEPAANVRVLAALGERLGGAAPVVLEGVTDARGFVRFALEPRSTAGRVGVLGVRDGHWASCGVDFSVEPPVQLLPRVLVYTDRPAYRPGETVHWRAIARGAEQGRLVVQPGRKFDWRVQDARGRAVASSTLTASEFGTLSGDFTLPEASPLGTWSLTLAEGEQTSFAATFTVAEFQLAHVALDVAFERATYYRGEEAVALIDARYSHGGPVADAPLSVELPDGRTSTARTDADGRARIAFATRDFAEEQVLALTVTLPEVPLSQGARAWLALREYTLVLDTARETVAADAPFTARVQARGADGEGIAAELELATFKLVHRPGRDRGETAVAKVAVATDAEGAAAPVLRIAQGGDYLLRLSGTDRFGNRIVAEHELSVVGEEDEEGLRLFADTDVLAVGADGAALVHERGPGGLALLTFESGRVVDWRWTRLARGRNALEFPVAEALAPGFVLSVAHQSRGKFRQAELEFRVERELTVTVVPRAATVAPGAETAIDVLVRDARGRPVAAELSLAVVDEALFQLYPESVPSLAAYFRPPAHAAAPAVEAESSCTFEYTGSTWEVAGEVLAEARRVLEDRKWQEDREGAAKLLAGNAKPLAAPAGPSSPGAVTGGDEFFLGKGGGGAARFGRRAGGAGGPSRGPDDAAKDKSAGPDPLGIASPTAYWTAALATDAEGKATATFRAPPNSARWRVSARAAAKDPRAANARAFFSTRADFFVELRTPSALVEGDRPRFFARLFNTTAAPLEAEVELVLRGAGLEATLPGGKLVVPPGSREIAFADVPATLVPGTLELALEARATAGGRALAARDGARLPVAAWGVEYSATESGELTSTATFVLELPRERKYTNLSLELFAGASLDAVLVDEALDRFPRAYHCIPGADGAARAADLLGAAEVLAQLARTGRNSSSDYARVRERTAALAAAVVAAADGDQGWHAPWRNADHEAEVTALSMLALAAARDAGLALAPEGLDGGLAALDRMQRSTGSEERRALIQHALARWDRGDYGALNRLHRLRGELSNAALAHAALALAALDRREMAGELAAVLESRALFDAQAPQLAACWSVEKNLPWSRSQLGTAAFCVLALERAAPRSPVLARGVQYLVAHRPWYDPRARGVALAALARHAGLTRPEAERCVVTAKVGDAAPVQLDLAPGSLVVPLDAAAAGRVKVELALAGRGAPHYAAILRGFSADAAERATRGLAIGETSVFAPAPSWRGRPVQVGFSTVENPREQWVNRIGALARGASAYASVTVRRDDSRLSAEERDWLVLEIPLPAGARVRPGSVQGGIASSEVLADRIVAYIPPDMGWPSVQFALDGAVPGHYRSGPPVVRRAGDPEVMAIGKARDFEILPLGATSSDAYRATPDELYALGMAAWNAGEHGPARAWLTLLMKDFQAVLVDDGSTSPLQQAAGALFFLALEDQDAAQVVRWFEVLREKRPDLVIPFDKILAVAAAYSQIDEHERALSILRASVEQTFGVDLKVAGALESQGDASASLDLLARLSSEYPDLPPVLETWLALSDKLLVLAPKASEDKSLVRDGKTRAALHLEGTRLLQLFLCLYPRDPQAPEAALNLVSAHLGLEDYQAVSNLAQAFAARFPKTEFADAFLYSRAVAEWYLGHDEEALRLCEKVAASVYTDAKGVERPSKNRELAQYILAQIHHARREVERAAEYYQRVEETFADAKAALAGLRERRLALDEVTRARPGETVRLELRTKNVAQVELAIYPVDLMTLYLREADLSKISQVELSGIAPEISRTTALGAENVLREGRQVLDLALPKTGAYLVIARGGELFASGLILVSELELDVTEDAERGHVRVQVVDGRDGKYVRDVDVRVVGSADRRIQRAKTDLRGMASLDSVQGLATVIARAGDNRYAFYRGTQLLGRTLPEKKALKERAEAPEQLSQGQYLENVLGFNAANQSQRAGRLVEEIQRDRPGVTIQQVK